MAKGSKKPLNGTPGGIFPATYRKDKVTLDAIDETDLNKNNEETTKTDPEQVSLKGVCEEKLKIEVLVTKTQNPVHVRTQAILVLSRLMDSDISRKILPFHAHHRVSHKTLTTSDDLPQNNKKIKLLY